MKILLDTNILLTAPSLLANSKPNVSLIIPQSALIELLISPSDTPKEVHGLMDSAIKNGNLEVYQPKRQARRVIFSDRVSGIDLDLLNCANELLESGDDVAIASDDLLLLKVARQYEIKTFNMKELKALFERDVEINERIKKLADSLLTAQNKRLLFGIVVGVAATFSANFIWSNFDKIISTFTTWGTLVGILFLGTSIYAVRGRYRLPYGVFEFFFGFITAIRVFWPHFNYLEFKGIDFLQIIAGLYIMVRGQDNIGRALRKTKFGAKWRKYSGEKE
jgi:rRNA maturation endonuclease Nob1